MHHFLNFFDESTFQKKCPRLLTLGKLLWYKESRTLIGQFNFTTDCFLFTIYALEWYYFPKVTLRQFLETTM